VEAGRAPTVGDALEMGGTVEAGVVEAPRSDVDAAATAVV
jgi:hypothetical protein